MNKETISDKQGISLIIMFIIGTSSIIVTGLDAKKDLWLATILAICMALLMVLVYARLHYIFPGKDLFDILEICFGKFIGKGIGLLYTWFAFHLTSLILRDFGEFYTVVATPETPMIVTMIITAFLSTWILKEGIEVLGRFSEFFLIPIVSLTFITILLLIPDMHINNIRPMFYEGIKPIIKGALGAFSFPFAEIIIFTMIFSTLKWKKSSYKVYIPGLLIAGVVIFFTSLTNVLVLGVITASNMYFPSYISATRVNVGEFLQRTEILIAFIFLIGGFVKMSICLLAACKGITKIFSYQDYRFIVTPLTLLLINLAYLISDNTREFYKWSLEIWPYYAFLFQVILPVFIFIAAEIKKQK